MSLTSHYRPRWDFFSTALASTLCHRAPSRTKPLDVVFHSLLPHPAMKSSHCVYTRFEALRLGLGNLFGFMAQGTCAPLATSIPPRALVVLTRQLSRMLRAISFVSGSPMYRPPDKSNMHSCFPFHNFLYIHTAPAICRGEPIYLPFVITSHAESKDIHLES